MKSQRIAMTVDEYHLLEYRATVSRIRMLIKIKGMGLLDGMNHHISTAMLLGFARSVFVCLLPVGCCDYGCVDALVLFLCSLPCFRFGS